MHGESETRWEEQWAEQARTRVWFIGVISQFDLDVINKFVSNTTLIIVLLAEDKHD